MDPGGSWEFLMSENHGVFGHLMFFFWGAFLGDLCSDQALTCKISVEEYNFNYNSYKYIIANDFIFEYISVTVKINFGGFPS